jgi:fructokinase
MNYVICIGEALIDFIPNGPAQSGKESEVCYQPHPGGAVANVSVAIARLRGASRFIGKVSEDAFGQLLTHVFVENAVDTSYLRSTKQGATALALVTLHSDGQREFAFYRHETADTLLEKSDLDWSAWDDAVICHAGSVSLSQEPARSATLAAMRHTRSQGNIVSFDANIRPAFWTTQSEIQETMAEVVALTDILKCSLEEAHFLDASLQVPLELDDQEGVQKLGQTLLAKGPQLVIITLGSQGAILMTDKQVVEVHAAPVKVVDTTGAGDAFMGAVLHTLIEIGCQTPSDIAQLSSDDLYRLGLFANTVAGISCTRYGGILSLPYIDEVHKLK